MGDGGKNKKEIGEKNRGDKFTLNISISEMMALLWNGVFLSFSVAYVVSLTFEYLGKHWGFASCFVSFGLFLVCNIAMTLRKIDAVGNSLASSFGNVMRNQQVVISRQRQELDFMHERMEEFFEDDEDWKIGGIYGEEDEDDDEGEGAGK